MSAAQEIETPAVYVRWCEYDEFQRQAEFLREEDPTLSEDAAFENACQDSEILTFAWEHVIESIQSKMNEYNPEEREWLVRGENLGWRNLSGTMSFSESEAEKFLGKFMPNTDKTFDVYVDDEAKTFSITCWHHDSPTGERYYISVSEENEDDF